MKLALLIASLATVVVASATELKDSATVAQEWQNTLAKTPPLAVVAPSLRSQVQTPPAFLERTFQEVPLWLPKATPKPEPSPFEGALRPKDNEGKMPPRGAKPYEFNGEKYWLIPLTT